MRLRGLAWILASVCLPSMLACGETKETTSSSTETTKAETKELTFVKYLDNQSGVSIVVRGALSQNDAHAWLSALVANEAHDTAEKLIDANKRLGLVRTSVGDLGDWPEDAPARVVSEYEDTKTGKRISVPGGTPQASAAAWLRQAADMSSVETLIRLLETHHAEGLLSAMITLEDIGKNGTVVSVAWGDTHRTWKPPTGIMDFADTATGRRISARVDAQESKAWLLKLVDCQGEADLQQLLMEGHKDGLVAARMAVYDAAGDYRIRTYWDE